MSIVKLFQDWWQGVVILFVLALGLGLLAVIVENWKIVFSVVGGIALVALAVVLAMLFGIPKWFKIIGGIIISISLFLWLGAGDFLQVLFISSALFLILNRFKK